MASLVTGALRFHTQNPLQSTVLNVGGVLGLSENLCSSDGFSIYSNVIFDLIQYDI